MGYENEKLYLYKKKCEKLDDEFEILFSGSYMARKFKDEVKKCCENILVFAGADKDKLKDFEYIKEYIKENDLVLGIEHSGSLFEGKRCIINKITLSKNDDKIFGFEVKFNPEIGIKTRVMPEFKQN